MRVGDLIDMLEALRLACEDVDPPVSEEEFRAMEITVRGSDDDGNDFCGALMSVDIEQEHGGDPEKLYLALDASNHPEDCQPREVAP